jgi:hypothetical protein
LLFAQARTGSAILRLFLLVADFWIVEPLAMRLAGADDRLAALLHGFRWPVAADQQRAAGPVVAPDAVAGRAGSAAVADSRVVGARWIIQPKQVYTL